MEYQQKPPAPELAETYVAAQVDADRVSSKPDRPWFTKTRFVPPLLLLAVVVMIQAAGGGYPGTSDTDGSDSQTATTAPRAQTAGIGVMVHDGMSEFLVTGVEHPGKSFQGKAGETLTALGEFVIVRVNITNVGKLAKAPNCSCERLFDDAGRKSEPSSAILSTKDALKFVQLIDPGDTVMGVSMLFDVAQGSTIVSIELHDSAGSDGVRVSLI